MKVMLSEKAKNALKYEIKDIARGENNLAEYKRYLNGENPYNVFEEHRKNWGRRSLKSISKKE